MYARATSQASDGLATVRPMADRDAVWLHNSTLLSVGRSLPEPHIGSLLSPPRSLPRSRQPLTLSENRPVLWFLPVLE
jgi:hypothetical protein